MTTMVAIPELHSHDRQFLLALRLDPVEVIQMSLPELIALVQRMLHVGEKLGVDEIPLPEEDADASKPDAFYRLQRNESIAGTGKWWFGWSINDLGWYSVSRGVELGCMVFLTCQLMTRLLLRPELFPSKAFSLADKSVLELGTGMGMLGISASAQAKNVMITDGEPATLTLAAVNAHLNATSGKVQIQQLRWGRKEATAFREQHGRFDCIIASDIVYEAQLALPSFECVDELLVTEPEGTYTLGLVERLADDSCPLLLILRGGGIMRVLRNLRADNSFIHDW